ncbi:MAG: transcription termination/antitermination protein NusA [Phycisphaerae bacterium]|nr:transcription termination factor NusA [Phycisphaerae bacterium]NUQ47849.1 transcription termination/antitermination protein NusA [Phycisphaerae bacterium]
MQSELLRIIDAISRDRNIEKDVVVEDLEQAMVTAVRKTYGQEDDVQVAIDRLTGEIHATRAGAPIEMRELGRIAAQTCKQVMIQRFRDAERGSIYQEFVEKRGTIITGTVSRVDGGALVVNVGRAEAFLPKGEQIPGETHQPGERIRAMVLDVREAPHQVKIILSRSHPDLIKRLFEQEVPEVSERVIEIKALAREAGYRTKVAVASIDSKVDAVGACVGVRGSRIKNIVEELGGEKIDIVRWNESSQILITNALRPAEVQDIALCFELGRATAVVPEDQLSLAIGKRGQNVRLAARLTGWDIDILTPKEYNEGLERLEKTVKMVEGIDPVLIEKLSLLGLVSVVDVEAVGTEPLVNELGITDELAKRIVESCGVEAKKVQEEMALKKAAKAAEAAAAAEAASEGGGEGAVAEGETGPTAEETTEPAAGGVFDPGGNGAIDSSGVATAVADGDEPQRGAVDAPVASSQEQAVEGNDRQAREQPIQ